MISQISLFTEDSGLEVDENSNKLSNGAFWTYE